MSKLVVIIFINLLAFAACKKRLESETTKRRVIMSVSSMENYAKEDFEAVQKGQKPIHAVPDPKKPDLSDGGTTFYLGKGYSLTIKSTLSEKDGVKGYMYGPIIIFQNANKEMSDIKFYSIDAFKKLRGY